MPKSKKSAVSLSGSTKPMACDGASSSKCSSVRSPSSDGFFACITTDLQNAKTRKADNLGREDLYLQEKGKDGNV